MIYLCREAVWLYKLFLELKVSEHTGHVYMKVLGKCLASTWFLAHVTILWEKSLQIVHCHFPFSRFFSRNWSNWLGSLNSKPVNENGKVNRKSMSIIIIHWITRNAFIIMILFQKHKHMNCHLKSHCLLQFVITTFMFLDCLKCVKDFATILIRTIVGKCVGKVFGLNVISNMGPVMTEVFTNWALHSSCCIFLDKLI